MTQYIDKSALVAEIEKKIMQYEVVFNNHSSASHEAWLIAKGKYRKLLDILKLIDTLEVKEVDLDKELDAMITPELKFHKALPSLFDVAKHFYELGLKTQKGE